LTRLPATVTGSRRAPSACARATPGRQQLQNTMPPACLRKLRRVVIGRLNRSLPPAVLRQLIDDGCIDKQWLDGARGAPICESYFVSTISKIGINRPSEVRRREQATERAEKKRR